MLGETRGNWTGSAIGTTREERNWALTAMGNWASRDIDLDGSGIDFAEDNLDPDLATHFSNANQWSRRNVTTGGSPVSLDYDDNGNLIDDGEQYAYIYDAWNRLVGVDSLSSDSPLTRYRYNGLGQRIVESDGTTNTSLIYDERWRLISRSESGKYTEETLYHHAGLDGYGGASDIDGVILRRTFLATGTPQTEDKRWYVLQNWRQDAAVIISDAGVQRERAFYSPYGRVFGMPAGDLNFDGEFTSTEATTISGWSAGYRAYADINLDGVIDGDDATANTPGALGWDALSRDGSTIGYAGYVQDSSIPTLSHVRHRVYKSDLGRWVQRDPAGYVDGASLYEYAMSSPVVMRDPMGLASQRGGCGLGGVGVDSCGGASLQLNPITCLGICLDMCSNFKGASKTLCVTSCIHGCSGGAGFDCIAHCNSLFPLPIGLPDPFVHVRDLCITACAEAKSPNPRIIIPTPLYELLVECQLQYARNLLRIEAWLESERQKCRDKHRGDPVMIQLCESVLALSLNNLMQSALQCLRGCVSQGAINSNCELSPP